MVRPLVLAAVWLTAVAAAPRAAVADDAKPAKQPSTAVNDPSNPRLWDTEVMMESAVEQLTKRYNLNPAQEAFTRKLLKDRVRAFLKEHESELRTLLTEAVELQRNFTKIDAKRMQNWAQRAIPLFDAARVAILTGNQEWRDILNDDQKRVHDVDLSQMRQNFEQMEWRFTKWSAGKFEPGDLVPNPPANTDGTIKTAGQVSRGPTTVSNWEDFWEQWVNSQISLYKFDEAQAKSARGILQECRQRAAQYRLTNKDKLNDLQAMEIALRGKPAQQAEWRKASQAHSDALKPITEEIFKSLKDRIEGLATQSQRESVQKVHAARREQINKNQAQARKQWEEQSVKMRSASRPARTSSAPSSQAARK